jgi:uncharacterized MAPEG superfamily protein
VQHDDSDGDHGPDREQGSNHETATTSTHTHSLTRYAWWRGTNLAQGEAMTPTLFCLFIAFVITILTKAPVAAAQYRTGGYDNRKPRDQQARLEGWGARALAAHLNAFEAFPAFAAAVLVAHVAGADPSHSLILAVVFLFARVLYTFCYIADLHVLRSLIWGIGFAATGGLFLLPLAG